MENISPVEQLLLRSRRLRWVLIGVTLASLAGTILFATLQLRTRIREQIAGRDGEVLDAVAFMHLAADLPDIELVGPLTDPDNQLDVVLKTSRLKGVVAARLFDANGHFARAFPPTVREAALDAQSLRALRELKPASRFHRAVRSSTLFLPPENSSPEAEWTLPLLEVNVPLHTGADRQLLGIAQFILEGQSIAAEYSQLDWLLARQALVAFLVGGGILTLTNLWAFRRLRGAQLLIAERTQSLVQANQALALAAKTSAVGAITSHLIHGLKNPLSGLQNLVASLASADAESPDADWEQAIVTTRRMQGLINQVVNVLREEEGSAQFQITLPELAEIVASKVRPLSLETGVRFASQVKGGAVLPNRTANLVALILVNLVQNALQATPRGRNVTLLLTDLVENLVCEVRDEGPGFPDTLADNLFSPCKSTKEGGSGIGLAISKQLANHLGAALELKSHSSAGCVFALTVPSNVGLEKSSRASSPLAC
jgi:signal transduction histidine kinase